MFFLMLLIVATLNSCQSLQESKLFTKTNKKGTSTAEKDTSFIRGINVMAQLDLLVSNKDSFTVPLPDGKEIIIVKQRMEGERQSLAWYGDVLNAKTSFVLFSVRGNAMNGRIELDNKRYRIIYIGNGVHQIAEIDVSKLDESDDDGVQTKYKEISDSETDGCPDPPSDIDVMVVYTQSAETGAGGTDGMESLIYECMYLTNLTYENSNINQRLRLVHFEKISYTETANSNTDLTRLKAPADGFMDNVHTLRNTYGADIVLLMVETTESGNCGRANIMDPVNSGYESSAFGVVKRECAADNLSFTHELGHTMGARHHDDATTTPYPYAHGHFNNSPSDGSGMGWETIMSKRSDCDRKKYFSNPDIQYSPTGSLTTDPMGTSALADNQSVLNNTASIAANLRCSSPSINNVWMKDTWEDTGLEPDPATATQSMYISPYIWIKNVQDPTFLYQHEHNNPEYGQTNWIYVKMHNGNAASQTGNLELYIADASLSLTWQSSWTLLSSIPVTLKGSSSKIVEQVWNSVPNPASGSSHYCMIARWVSATDPMHTIEGSDINFNVRENNNIIWRNLNIIDVTGDSEQKVAFNINSLKSENASKIVFEEITKFPKPKFLKTGKIIIQIDDKLFNYWKEGGSKSTGLKQTNPNIFEVSNNLASLDNIKLPSDYKGKISIRVIKSNNTQKNKFDFSVKQYDMRAQAPYMLGGIDYEIWNR